MEIDLKKLPDLSEFTVSPDGTVDMNSPENLLVKERTLAAIEHNKHELERINKHVS